MASFTFDGSGGTDVIAVAPNGQRIVLADNNGNVLADLSGVDDLLVNGNAGDDTVNASALPAGLTQLTIDGGPGNDTIIGSQGADTLLGGSGSDIVTGGRGNDLALLGSGDDKFIWNPGDGSDVVEGESGFDTLAFNGSNASENISISANGSRATLFRDVANITMDLNGVERIQVAALGSADNITVNDLTGTDVQQVVVDLAAAGGIGDGQPDTVTVNGTAGNNSISIASSGASVIVTGLSAQVTVSGAEAANDMLVVNGLDGNDTIDASALSAGQIKLTIDAGGGNDVVRGSAGNDLALLGAGDDRFIWNPGDGSDTVDGQAGNDVLEFNGSNAGETISIVANGQRVAVTRDIGSILMDVNGVEHLMISANGGDDVIFAGNGLSALTSLTIDGGAGNDRITGGDGADMLIGGDGNDIVNGGRGNDVALLGAGDDIFSWNPGDGSDVVEGQAGFDTLAFNGSNIGENIAISANGSRALFTRDIANVTMDLNGVERIQFQALGGADNIVVNDLTGTGVKQVAIDLGPIGGSGDGQPDTVTVNGTAANNAINITASGSLVTVSGLAAQVSIDHADSGDRLVINAGAGNDTINASALPAGPMSIVFNGGAGNDILIGSGGNDVFGFVFGESGRDVVLGFQAHGAGPQGDVVALSGFADHAFDQAVAAGHIAQMGANVVISDGASVVATLQNVALASLHANDFLFS